ncbi:unnamed protein product [Cylicocyclus nassatus]|uniref:Uncharacterized protein n=1 Tax=Cylicocyclus nassatus TaxID=53992 RepID=A0AA36GS66_CYLNA|nr:unnamed protein product [Cylicocyclus nassatus]
MMNKICWRILAILLLWSKTFDEAQGRISKRIRFEKIGKSHKSLVPEKCKYDHALVAGDKIWIFGRRFVNQETSDLPHSVAYVGTYAIAFNTAKNKWEDAKSFSALSNDQNLDEKFFIHNGAPHVLLYKTSNEISLEALYKWTGTKFESVRLQPFNSIVASDSEFPVNGDLQIADSQDDNTKYIITTLDNQMRVARLKFSGNGAKAEHLFEIPADDESEQLQATSAVASGSRLLVSYSITNYGYQWTAESIIACDLNSQSCETLEINSISKPRWSFNGARAHALLPSGSWIHAAGQIKRGKSGGAFDGSVWELNNLKSSPKWKKLKVKLPKMEEDEEVVIDPAHKTIYCIGNTQIGKVKIA